MPLATFAAPSQPASSAPSTLTRTQAASRLGMSPAGIDKMIRAGIFTSTKIPSDEVAQLAARPWLKVTDGELTVLRTDAKAPAYPGEDRDFIGFHTQMSDDEIEAASLRWWRSDPDRVLGNELFTVCVATIPVAVFHVTGHQATIVRADEDKPRHHYAGQLLARAYPGMVFNRPELKAFPGPLAVRAAQIMSSRVSAEAGGPIAYLNADS